MALFVRDEAVDGLATELHRALKTKTKADAVKIALANELERVRSAVPLRIRLSTLQAKARTEFPTPIAGVDMKNVMDALWEDGE
ncbi:hypothetical protein EYD00_24335 (plasmid) [Agrobacterium sp. 33MFTa1.1]|jgi:antitoxin VapB|uniref:Antitoxin VapB n=1 Tax=Agrobacterium pusense TaxID=648995 RepID=U4QIU0_9HYPH|nr:MULTISPECIES: type II toxin-antitoxin system VapB family antitoxin [Agrobacterium]OAI82928.1 hypothetical protein AYO27_17390 [Rhizobium sp. GHKF11]MBA8801623.1 antitoxin VapB [Agrobacterium sp. RC10-4-1]MBW9060306.1 type II toxin-antitoxin system VapB family antitoxin [Agrobacterium pusense]MBW9081213.1 type II toxin-antitoxin system VapB family antitoxin [Agrobacterium pusense]NTE47946.1 type II toxin-antitoxin system VapB family antitoxin [Agrobacterium pusense]